MKNSLMTFPDKIGQLDTMIEINTQQPLGLTAQVFVIEIARKLPLYNQEIDCAAQGQDKEGTIIHVNTVGRWLFGVPGYIGHFRIVPSDNTIAFYFPNESPKVVHDLVLQIKEAVEAFK